MDNLQYCRWWSSWY